MTTPPWCREKVMVYYNVRTANRYIEVLYNVLPFTLIHFFENILEFVRQISIIPIVVYVSINKVMSHF